MILNLDDLVVKMHENITMKHSDTVTTVVVRIYEGQSLELSFNLLW